MNREVDVNELIKISPVPLLNIPEYVPLACKVEL
jgi:hypothetical protein